MVFIFPSSPYAFGVHQVGSNIVPAKDMQSMVSDTTKIAVSWSISYMITPRVVKFPGNIIHITIRRSEIHVICRPTLYFVTQLNVQQPFYNFLSIQHIFVCFNCSRNRSISWVASMSRGVTSISIRLLSWVWKSQNKIFKPDWLLMNGKTNYNVSEIAYFSYIPNQELR